MQAAAYARWNPLLLAVTLVAVNACGGGGGGGDTSTTTTTGSATTTTATTTSTTLAPVAAVFTLSGVAASGAPLLGATVKVVDAIGAPVNFMDATGALVSSGTTSPADGAYRLVLATSSPKVPLFIQVVGTDAAGNQVVLHSLLQTTTLPLIANVTPATNAVVAQVLGTDPKNVFVNAISNASSIALLGNAASVTSASDLVKSIIKTNLTDGKITDSKKLDFFQDAAFSANKGGLDAALEGLRIQIVKDASGKELLQFSNKFNLPSATEVSIDLATAKAELAKTTGGSVAKAIISTLKATTSPTSSLANLGVLDDLSIALNKLIAQGATTAEFQSSAMLATYVSHNGRSKSELADKLASYAENNYQLSKLQVAGCADNPLAAKGCVKVLVTALVTDKAGQRVEVFSDAATYSKSTTPNWVLVGNGLAAGFAVYPVAYASYGLDGVLKGGTAANPGYGVQVVIVPPAGDYASRIVQIPSGYSIPFAYCDLNTLCVKTSPTADPVASGELQDMLPQQLSVGTLGNLDSLAGAKYLVSQTGSTVITPAYLPAEVSRDLGNAPFPMLNGLAAKPLTKADITAGAGLSLSWEDWAAANPNMRMFLVRTMVSNASSYLYSDAELPLASGKGIKVPALAIPASFVPTRYQVWLGAQDSLGRRYYSQFVGTP